MLISQLWLFKPWWQSWVHPHKEFCIWCTCLSILERVLLSRSTSPPCFSKLKLFDSHNHDKISLAICLFVMYMQVPQISWNYLFLLIIASCKQPCPNSYIFYLGLVFHITLTWYEWLHILKEVGDTSPWVLQVKFDGTAPKINLAILIFLL